MRKIITLLVLTLLAVLDVAAVKMKPGAFNVRQADGTILTVIGHGDERAHWLTTLDGAMLCQRGKAYFVAAHNADGSLRPTLALAHNAGRRSAAEQKLIDSQDRAAMRRAVIARAPQREPMADEANLVPHTGSPRVPVVLVEFADTLFRLADPHAAFDKYLNATGYFDAEADVDMYRNRGSVRQYFDDMSFGQFTPQFDVLGPVRLAQPLAYYGAGSSNAENVGGLLRDACAQLDPAADYSQYDNNGDGRIDLVYVIFAGYSQSIGGNSSDCLWPKSGWTSGLELGGMAVARYGINNELGGTPATGTKINGIGLFCHEFSHCLGLPDVYPSPTSEASTTADHGMDYWDLMDAGEYTYNGYRPTAYTAWERERFGWLTIDTLSQPADITMTTLDDGGRAYRLLGPGNDYYLIENVQKQGWNTSLFGHGLLATHIDYDATAFRGASGTMLNSTLGHPRYHLAAADGLFLPETLRGAVITQSGSAAAQEANATLYDRYLGQTITTAIYKAEAAGDTYPGTAGVTAFGPAAKLYSGGTLGEAITDIAEEGGVITFKYKGGSPSGIRELPAESRGNTEMLYTITGRRINAAAAGHGIYIKDGRKIAF